MDEPHSLGATVGPDVKPVDGRIAAEVGEPQIGVVGACLRCRAACVQELVAVLDQNRGADVGAASGPVQTLGCVAGPERPPLKVARVEGVVIVRLVGLDDQ